MFQDDDHVTATMSKETLLESLKENREKHKKIYEEACETYRVEATKILKSCVKDLKKGLVVPINRRVLPVPVSHVGDYDTVIHMLSVSTDESVTLTYSQFKKYVLDDWEWKPGWVTSTANYSQSYNMSVTSAGAD